MPSADGRTSRDQHAAPIPAVPLRPDPGSVAHGGNGQATNGHAPSGRDADHGSSLRRQLLTELRRGGPASPDQLADRLGVSRSGVVQQLHALEGEAFVTRETVRHGVGRPRHVYDVTPAAQPAFPANYDGLAAGLLDALAEVGGDDLLSAVFTARRELMVPRLREQLSTRVAADAPLSERVRELAVIQDELGYLSGAEPEDDGSVRLVQHNCAIYRVASGTPAACDAEIALFAEVLDAEVVRERHIASGDRCCSYRITPRGS